MTENEVVNETNTLTENEVVNTTNTPPTPVPSPGVVSVNKKMNEIPCGEFQYRGDVTTLGQRWTCWMEKFNLYVAGNDLRNDVIIKARFLLLMGDEAMDVYRVKKKLDDSDTLIQVKKFMTDHFVVAKSEYSEVVTFRNTFRREGERVNEFIMRLRQLATNCQFGTGLEKKLERQFVVGCRMLEVQNKCSRSAGLDLNGILDIAIGHERVRSCMNELNGVASGSRTVNYTSTNPAEHKFKPQANNYENKTANSGPRTQMCGNCGNPEHAEGIVCKAKDKQCGNCGKLNHFRKVCRQPDQQQQTHHQNNRYNQIPCATGQFRSRDNNSNGNKRVNYNNNAHQRGSYTSNSNGQGKIQPRTKINAIVPEPTGKDDTAVNHRVVGGQMVVNSEEYAAFVRYQALLDYGIRAITVDRPMGAINRINLSTPPKITVELCDTRIRMMVDTGAPINVMDEATFAMLHAQPFLEPCKTQFYGYTSSIPLETLGEFKTEIRFKDRVVDGWFIVVRGSHECLLSHNSAIELNIIQIQVDADEENGTPPVVNIIETQRSAELTIAEFKTTFPALFSGKLGCLKN